jgi:hypothetical protein
MSVCVYIVLYADRGFATEKQKGTKAQKIGCRAIHDNGTIVTEQKRRGHLSGIINAMPVFGRSNDILALILHWRLLAALLAGHEVVIRI